MKLGRHILKPIKIKGDILLTDGKEKIKLIDTLEIDVKEVSVFVYDDSTGERVATTKQPLIEIGEVKKLKVVSKTKYGYFVDIGLDKDIFLPYKEKSGRINEGQYYLMSLYIDRSDRLCVSMKLKDRLKKNDKFKVNDKVKATVYEIDKIGLRVAIEEEYDGLIPKEEIKGIYELGDEIEARVMRIVRDGRITLTIRKKAYKQLKDDAKDILEILKEHGGVLNISDKSDKDKIKSITGLSKNAFKRSIGSLYKEKKIEIYDNKIELKK